MPKGRVLAYSQVAALAGIPGAARRVGKALGGIQGLPWWRIVRADLTTAKEVAAEQARRLGAEGVIVRGRRIPASARISVADMMARLGLNWASSEAPAPAPRSKRSATW